MVILKNNVPKEPLSMGDALDSLEDQYIFLTNHLDDLLGACQTQDQKDAIIAAYVDSRRNYWSCINQTFHDDDPKVAAATKQMGAVQQNLEHALAKLNEISKVIDALTAAVKAGGGLAALVG
jgi:hypothetical protein